MKHFGFRLIRRTAAAASLAAAMLLAAAPSPASPVLSAGSDTVNIGDTFTIAIAVGGTTGLTSYQFDLGFDPTILKALGFDDSTTNFATEAGNEGGALTGLTGFIDNGSGLLSGVADSMSGAFGPGLTPGGTIVDITFEALAAGTSALALSNGFLIDDNNFLFSGNGDFGLSNGLVTVQGLTAAIPEPGALSLFGTMLVALAMARRPSPMRVR